MFIHKSHIQNPIFFSLLIRLLTSMERVLVVTGSRNILTFAGKKGKMKEGERAQH